MDPLLFILITCYLAVGTYLSTSLVLVLLWGDNEFESVPQAIFAYFFHILVWPITLVFLVDDAING